MKLIQTLQQHSCLIAYNLFELFQPSLSLLKAMRESRRIRHGLLYGKYLLSILNENSKLTSPFEHLNSNDLSRRMQCYSILMH